MPRKTIRVAVELPLSLWKTPPASSEAAKRSLDRLFREAYRQSFEKVVANTVTDARMTEALTFK